MSSLLSKFSLGLVGLKLVLLTSWADQEFEGPAGEKIIFAELSRKQVRQNDQLTTLVRVRPPVLPKAPPTPLTSKKLSAAEQAESDRLAKKAYVSLDVNATVYQGTPTVTELRWRNEDGDGEYRAWSNVDFRYLSQLHRIETATTVYDWQPAPLLQTCAPSDFPAGQKPPIPKNLNLSATTPDYVTDSGVTGQETVLAGLDTLHAYYQLHAAELKAAYEKARAASDAEQEQLRLNPPKKPDTTLRFWVRTGQ
jgi:hypothetical protein